ncbi:MAG: hypothetical protein R3Y19_01215 [Rikenellaceae bacterium]
MKKTLLIAAVALTTMATSCCSSENDGKGKCDSEKHDCKSTSSCSSETKCKSKEKTTMAFQKKYTNADFYKDGVFQEKVAEQAFREMFEFYGYEVTPFLEENWWFVDFGLGDFENCGMGGVFWLNDPVSGYFAHDIYLLPGQMIPEHKHVETEFPAKMESWMVRSGWCYNFSEVGDPTPDAPAIPESQAATTISKKFIIQGTNGVTHLADAGKETYHFLMAGPEGAIVHEYANYHDGAGLRFTNPKAKM